MKKLLFTVLAVIFLLSCSEKDTPKQKELDSEIPKDSLSEIERKEKSRSYKDMDSSIAPIVMRLDSMFDTTPFFTLVDGKKLFYVCKGKWKNLDDGKFNDGSFSMGISDDMGVLVLPIEYDKIYNPDATAKGYIEIESKGKRGLFNYRDYSVIPPSYDVLFPSSASGRIAVGKKGDEHYSIYPDGKQTLINNEAEVPTYISQAMNWSFNARSKNTTLLYDCYAYYPKQEGEPLEGCGLVFTPSYLFQLGFLPEIHDELAEGEKDPDFGVTQSEGKIVKSIPLTDKISAFIASFYEEGVDARGWQLDNHNLITVDSKNNIISSEFFLNQFNLNEFNYCEKKNGYELVSKNLLAVHDLKRVDSIYSKYDFMTLYSFYRIKEDGKIEKLESPRLFDFTKYHLINEKYFEGCFSRFRSDNEEADGNVLLAEHLDLEDLDLMRNEIYAEYGLKFKSEKWINYFGKQSWYKPAYDNVDQFLTEIDKENLKTILRIKEKMTGREKEFTRKEWIHFAVAG